MLSLFRWYHVSLLYPIFVFFLYIFCLFFILFLCIFCTFFVGFFFFFFLFFFFFFLSNLFCLFLSSLFCPYNFCPYNFCPCNFCPCNFCPSKKMQKKYGGRSPHAPEDDFGSHFDSRFSTSYYPPTLVIHSYLLNQLYGSVFPPCFIAQLNRVSWLSIASRW